MSILCCCRGSKTTSPEANSVTVELPAEPPQVKLWGSPCSQSNTEAISSQPIPAAQAPSRLESPVRQAMIDPATLNIDDSDDEDGIFRNTRSSSTSTLGAIKTKFIRRRSPASDAKPRSQPSVIGNSDEEIARRAELKRLMHKRIQEELKNEEEEQGVSSRHGTQRRNHEKISQPELPRGGPRDTIEFSVEEMNEIKDNGLKCTSPEIIPLAFPVDESLLLALRRRSSALEFPGPSGDTMSTKDRAVMTEGISQSQMPSSPELAPVHLSSLRDSCSTHSWRLSYSAEQLTSILAIHEGSTCRFSYSNDTDANADVTKNEGERSAEDEFSAPEKTRGSSEFFTSHDLSESSDLMFHELDPEYQDFTSDRGSNPIGENGQVSNTTSYRDSPLVLWLRSQELQSSLGLPTVRNMKAALSRIPESYSREIEAPVNNNQIRASQEAGTQTHPPTVLSQSGEPQTSVARKSCELVKSTDPGRDHILAPNQKLEGLEESSSSRYTSSRYTTIPNSTQPSHKSSLLSLKEFFGSSRGTSIVPIPRIHRKA